MAELKPCPFCGGNLKEMKSDYTFGAPKNLCQLDYICECGMRFTKTVYAMPDDKDVAFRVWNTRAPKETHEKHTETHDSTPKEKGD